MMVVKRYDASGYFYINKNQVTFITDLGDLLVHIWVVGREDPLRAKGPIEPILAMMSEK